MSYYYIGLRNPEPEFENTRHNAGYMFLNYLTKDRNYNTWFNPSSRKFKYKVYHPGCVLVAGNLNMNHTGEIIPYLPECLVTQKNVLVISDDFTIPCGEYRLRMKGSHGGHNGLRNIEKHLGTDDFIRLRIGIGPLVGEDIIEFVLGKFSEEEIVKMEASFEAAISALEHHKLI